MCKPHRIEIWFGINDGTLYLLSGGRDSADWVKNLKQRPAVKVRINSRTAAADARILRPNTKEDTAARRLLESAR